MRAAILLASILLLGACASQAPREAQVDPPASAAAFAASAAPVRPPAQEPAEAAESAEGFTAMRTVTSQEADNGRVCEYRKRPGSHIAEKYCYTRQEHLANQEVRDEFVRQQLEELQREQRMLEERQRQMEMERRRRPSGFGSGRN